MINEDDLRRAAYEMSCAKQCLLGLIKNNGSDIKDRYGDQMHRNYTEKTLGIFALAIKAIEAAYIYTDEIRLVVGCDTGENELEQSISERLNKNST